MEWLDTPPVPWQNPLTAWKGPHFTFIYTSTKQRVHAILNVIEDPRPCRTRL